jgi:hypothetical protein
MYPCRHVDCVVLLQDGNPEIQVAVIGTNYEFPFAFMGGGEEGISRTNGIGF